MQKKGELSVVDKFYTIVETEVEREIIEKKSRFIANIFYVQDVIQAEEIIKKYWKAN